MSTKNKNENKPVPTLMRKTKAQLVDIILRKDSIECNLRNDIKDKDSLLNHYKENLVNANNQTDVVKQEYETLKAEYESTCDESASVICDLKETIKHDNSVIIKLYACLVVSFVIILGLIVL